MELTPAEREADAIVLANMAETDPWLKKEPYSNDAPTFSQRHPHLVISLKALGCGMIVAGMAMGLWCGAIYTVQALHSFAAATP